MQSSRIWNAKSTRTERKSKKKKKKKLQRQGEQELIEFIQIELAPNLD